jgi:hypothetical protein
MKSLIIEQMIQLITVKIGFVAGDAVICKSASGVMLLGGVGKLPIVRVATGAGQNRFVLEMDVFLLY